MKARKRMKHTKLYNPENDPYYGNPYIDVEEWREKPLHHYFVHGGFRGTEKEGYEAKFCFYFPEKSTYEERFFQYLSPAPEDEHMSEYMADEEDKISFSINHGAYYVVSNQGGNITDDSERLYKTNANVAEFSRKTAQRVYDYEHRPYGYVHGGSGGSFKTISCLEMTEGVWDGGVPFVIANPMATPNAFCSRVRAMRVLGEDGMAHVMDQMEPGGSGNIYKGLTAEQQEILQEATRMGFPRRGWFCGPFMGDGALMLLVPYIYQMYPQYFTDFWTKEGYEGANPDSSEVKARVQFVTTVGELIRQEKMRQKGTHTGVEDNWMNVMDGNQDAFKIRLSEYPPKDAYLYHCRIRVLSGEAEGKESAVDTIENGVVSLSRVFDGSNRENALAGLAVGDCIMIDNSDYLALQTLHRHQIPDTTYRVYEQFRKKDGTPMYPQLPILLGPAIAKNGGGSIPTGDIHGKVITLCNILDEGAPAWHGVWFRDAVQRQKGNQLEECFRLYFNDNCIHGNHPDDPQHHVSYSGILNQTLLTLADWCEKGINPPADTNYTYDDGQIELPDTAEERGGVQPVIRAMANGEKSITVKVGDQVNFTAEIKAPEGASIITYAAWDFEKTNNYSNKEVLNLSDDGKTATVATTHTFIEKGTYFPVIVAWSNQNADGSTDDYYTRCKNLDRVRVIVKE